MSMDIGEGDCLSSWGVQNGVGFKWHVRPCFGPSFAMQIFATYFMLIVRIHILCNDCGRWPYLYQLNHIKQHGICIPNEIGVQGFERSGI